MAEIECFICNWQPDGKPYWSCSCGHNWNTFDTAGKCPNCGIQWTETRCPSCEVTSPHKSWYAHYVKSNESEFLALEGLKSKKYKLEARLEKLGITNYKVHYLPYVDHARETFQTPFDVGCRLIILYAVAYATHNLEDRPKLIDWLKREDVWDKVSPEEKSFLCEINPTEKKLIDLSWRFQGALILGWALNLFDKIHDVNVEETEEEVAEFLSKVPAPGQPLHEFLNEVRYRSIEEIYEENLLNEIVTTYFRDLMFNGNEDVTNIHPIVSFERHIALNWVRQAFGVKEWDETDTST